MLKKILVTGGDGRFAQELKKIKSRYKFIYRSKKQLNILSTKSIKKNFQRFKPHTILHLAGLSRPKNIHDKKINSSIDLNIIGTANIVKLCKEKKIKIIELTPRLSGGFDAQYRKPISYDLNLIKYTILIAMNIKFDINNLRLNFKKYSSTFSVLFDEGIFQKFENIEKIKKIKNINKIFLLSKKNDKIEKLTNCSQRNNYFICSADSKKQLYNTHEKIKKLLNIKYA